jgi:hypothetical protein
VSNSKISALTSASTPLAGTEVLPIVQSSTTKQVSVANLTAGRTQTSNGIVQGTAATGYNFNANTPASGMTSQLLNWYEEGNFTPTVVGTTTAGTVTYVRQAGKYTRIGRNVTFIIDLAWNSGTGTGNLQFNGLPFTSVSGINVGVAANFVDSITLAALSYLQGWLPGSSTSITAMQSAVGGGAVSNVAYDGQGSIMLSGSYFV